MKAAGVLVFTGGLDPDAPVFNVDAFGGSPKFTDGPVAGTMEVIGGVAVIDVENE